MASNPTCFLENRGVISVSGKDAAEFLQGLVSNDVTRVSESHAIWAAFLTPQGKFLHEFMIAKTADHYILDCEKSRRDDLVARLSRYKLRAKVTIEASEGADVAAAWGEGVAENFGLELKAGASTNIEGALLLVDPRLEDAGIRLIGSRAALEPLTEAVGCHQTPSAAYASHRIILGLPDGSQDMEVEKALLLENGFDELGGVDFDKGCYIGQELTARTHYRALIKKRLLPVKIEGASPPPGAALTAAGKHAGEMKSSVSGYGLALVRLGPWQSAEDGVLTAGDAKITPVPPPWMKLPSLSGA